MNSTPNIDGKLYFCSTFISQLGGILSSGVSHLRYFSLTIYRNMSRVLCIILTIALLSNSAPAAPKIIAAEVGELSRGTAFWLSSNNWVGTFVHLFWGRRAISVPKAQESPTSPVSRIRIFPGDVTLTVGDHAFFAAVAYNPDDEPINSVTFTWQSEDTGHSFAARQFYDGDFEGLYPGEFKVKVEGGGQIATVNVTVLANEAENSQFANQSTATRDVSTRDLPVVRTRNKRERASSGQGSGTTPPSLLPNEGGWDDSNYYSALDPSNGVGHPPGHPIDDGAGSGNFQLTSPVITLPSRSFSVSLSLAYNSLQWNKAGTQLTYDIDRGWPSPGWSLGFGKILGMGVNNGSMMVDSDGTRHGYSGTVYFGPNNDYTNFLGHTTDGTFIDYGVHTGLGGVLTGGWAKLPTGTLIDYTVQGDAALYPTRITDVHGNYITVTYRNNQGPAIETITDTMGRVITFNYDTQGRLTSISAPKLSDGTRTLVRLHYKIQDLSALGSNYGFSTSRTTVVRNSTPWVLDAIFYPATGTGYWFGDTDSYSPYGMISKVVQQRGMSWTPTTGNEQGTISVGTMTQQSIYNYPAQPNSSLTDAPTYSTKTDSWAGMDTGNAVTIYEVHQNSSPRSVKTTQPDGTWTEQLSYNYSTLPANDPDKYKDGLIYQDETRTVDGTLLSKSTSTWAKGDYDTARPVRIEATNERNQTTAAVFTYGSNYNQAISVENYDYGGTVLKLKTVTDYENSTNYTNRHIFSLVKKVQVFAADGVTRVSQIDYQYDGATPSDTPGVIMYLQKYNAHTTETCACGACLTWETPEGGGHAYCVEHAQVSVYDPTTAYQGNVTQVKTYADAANLTGSITEERRYDITGNLITSSTSCCEQSSSNYTVATQYAYPISKTRGAADPNSNSRVTSSAVYDFNTGLILSTTDANGRTSSTAYDSGTLRPVTDTAPAGAYLTYSYDDVAMTVSETTRTADGAIAAQNVRYLNGLGQVRRRDDLGVGGVWDVEETKYTKFGQVWMQSRSYRSGQEQPQWVESSYDALGRLWKIHYPDGSESYAYYNETVRPDSASSDPGQTIRIKDAWGNERWGRSDANGRLVEVVEPNPNGNGSVMATGSLVTTYQYDALGRLTQSNQGSQARKFAYDTLGRLTRQKLAEQNATLNDAGQFVGVNAAGAQWSEVFTYDQRSNLISRIDARGVKTLFSYQVSGVDDPLNRLQSVSYDLSGPLDSSSPIAPAANVSYEYMSTGDVTRLLRMTASGVSTEQYAYDTEGRISDQTVTLTSRSSYPMVTSYIYDSLDRVKDVRYPAQYGVTASPRKIVHHEYDIESRLNSLQVDGVNYASEITYNAASQTTSLKVGVSGSNQITESYQYEAQTGLLSNQKVQRAGASLLDLSYNYLRAGTTAGRTGQLTEIINNLDRNKDKRYEYDTLGRLIKATGGVNASWSQTYAYDRYGNRTSVTRNGVESLRAAQVAPESKAPEQETPTIQLAANSNSYGLEIGANPVQGGISDSPPSLLAPVNSRPRSDQANNVEPSLVEPMLTSQNRTPFDFDGDGKADVSAWRRSTGVWSIKQSSDSTTISPQLGSSGDQIVPGDYDGDGKTDVAIWHTATGEWSIKQSSNGNIIQQQFGQSSDTPVAADYDGDGKTDIAVWRASTGYWYILRSTDGTVWWLWGGVQFGDIAAQGDYDGDGKADTCVWRPSTGYWYVQRSSDGQTSYQQWGQAGDVPVPADYDGDHITDTAVWRPSTGYWYVLQSHNGSITSTLLGAGTANDITVPADYDGDGKADVAMWRPSTGVWTIVQSSDGTTTTQSLGASVDVPVPSAYLRRSSAPRNQSMEIPRDGLENVTYESQTNRITNAGFQYDMAGNQTRILAQGGTSWERMEYDAANRLIKVKDDAGNILQSYTYGASNARLITQDGAQSNNRTYYAWSGSEVIAEYVESAASPTIPQWSKSNIFLANRLLSVITPGGSGETVQFYHPDRLGTHLITYAANTNVTEQATLPYGTALDSESTGASNRRFTSYDRSSVTGLDYAKNRHYDPQQGRFTQVDPIEMNSASLINPQSLNLFSYCGNDPINRIDPSGLLWGKLLKWISKVLKWVVLAVTVAVMVLSFIVVPGSQGILPAIYTKLLAILAKFGSIAKFISGGALAAEGASVAAAGLGIMVLSVLSASVGAVTAHFQKDEKPKIQGANPEQLALITAALDELIQRIKTNKDCAKLYGGKDKALKALKDSTVSVEPVGRPQVVIKDGQIIATSEIFGAVTKDKVIKLGSNTTLAPGGRIEALDVASQKMVVLQGPIATADDVSEIFAHELAHRTKAKGIVPDDDDPDINKTNDDKVRKACGYPPS